MQELEDVHTVAEVESFNSNIEKHVVKNEIKIIKE